MSGNANWYTSLEGEDLVGWLSLVHKQKLEDTKSQVQLFHPIFELDLYQCGEIDLDIVHSIMWSFLIDIVGLKMLKCWMSHAYVIVAM